MNLSLSDGPRPSGNDVRHIGNALTLLCPVLREPGMDYVMAARDRPWARVQAGGSVDAIR